MSDEQIDVVAALPAEIEVTNNAPAVVDVLDAAPALIDVIADAALVEAAASGALVDLVAGVPAEIEVVDGAPALIEVIAGVPGPPGAPGSGGGGIDYVQQADPGAVGARKTWLQLAPARNPPAWGGGVPYVILEFVQPTVPNGHRYQAQNAGTSDVVEPVWPTNGSSVVDGTITWNDSGLLGIVSQNQLQLWVRNAANSNWLAAGVSSKTDDSVTWGVRSAAGLFRAEIAMDPNGVLTIVSSDAGSNPLTEITLSNVACRVTTTGIPFEVNGRDFLSGSVDPSAGAGVVAPLGSYYSRDTGTVGELWFKTGTADTAWTKVV